MNRSADRWIQWTTIGCVALLALIAGTVSYLHMHMLVELHGQPGWVAALTPLSVDGMIVAASTTLLADSRSGRRGGMLPWALLAAGSVASLAANVAVAEPSLVGRVIAAWPSFALTASYELLTRQVRRRAASVQSDGKVPAEPRPSRAAGTDGRKSASALTVIGAGPRPTGTGRRPSVQDLQQRAWQWAMSHRGADGSFPSGKQIASRFGRHERWGRLVKRAGIAGQFSPRDAPGDLSHDDEMPEAAAT
jgi:hypothetical protein